MDDIFKRLAEYLLRYGVEKGTIKLSDVLVGGVMDDEGDHRDVREVIFWTRKISNIKGDLQPGDVVLIPIEVRK